MHDLDRYTTTELLRLLLAEADTRMTAVSDAERLRAADRILAIAAALESRGLSPSGRPRHEHASGAAGAALPCPLAQGPGLARPADLELRPTSP